MSQPAEWAAVAWERVKSDQARADFLEELYQRDGRDADGHPQRKTYTGLYQKYVTGEHMPR